MFYKWKLERLFLKNLTTKTRNEISKNNSLQQKQFKQICKRDLQPFVTLEGLIAKSSHFHAYELPWYVQISISPSRFGSRKKLSVSPSKMRDLELFFLKTRLENVFNYLYNIHSIWKHVYNFFMHDLGCNIQDAKHTTCSR